MTTTMYQFSFFNFSMPPFSLHYGLCLVAAHSRSWALRKFMYAFILLSSRPSDCWADLMTLDYIIIINIIIIITTQLLNHCTLGCGALVKDRI